MKLTRLPPLELNVDDFMLDLENTDMTYEEKVENTETIWALMNMFVDSAWDESRMDYVMAAKERDHSKVS